ncbi:MAG: hypothetical protein R3F43_28060 [bacterium]
MRGILVGNATATDSIELFGSARVVGDLVAPRIVVREEPGSGGLIDMGDPEDGRVGPAGASGAAAARDPKPPGAPPGTATARPAARPRPAPADAEDDADAEEP